MRRSDDDRPNAFGDPNVDPAAASSDQLSSGTDIGGYIVDGELGRGGMGVVYSATHPVIGKRAAIKVLKPELSNNPAAVERFVMEARAVNQIGHPNIVDIFAFGYLPDGRSYYVMDLLNGESLRRRLKRTGALHMSEAASAIDEVASALMAAHDKGIIHRDLKPDNVYMVSVPGRWPEVRILDWGLLKLSSGQSAVASGKYKTLAGSVMGTPVYMSPEQARASDAVDFRTDIYSLGVMAYEILAGSVPFKRGSSIDTLLAHQDEPVPPLAQKCPALPEELVQLIEAMLAKEPEDRPTLAAVRAVLKRLKGNKIPTMTAAGLEMPVGPMTPFVEPPTNSGATLDEGALRASRELTVPRLPTPIPGSLSALPLPPPPLTPMHERPSTPFHNMNIAGQTTLAGHSMPNQSSARQAAHRAPSAPGYPPSSSNSQLTPAPLQSGYPQQHHAPHGQPHHMQHGQPPQVQHRQLSGPGQSGRMANPHAQASNAKRVIVIMLVAIIASAVGIILLLSN